MKTPHLKPRRMWANYYRPEDFPFTHSTKELAAYWAEGRGQTVSVTVIPHGEHKALVAKIARKLWHESERSDGCHTVRAVLDCLGVISKPKRKK